MEQHGSSPPSGQRNSNKNLMFTIYLATCLVNYKVYVGQTNTFLSKRRWAHVNRKDYDDFFHRALRKYGEHNFIWEILGKAETKEEANNLERIWIVLLRSKDREYGYNLTAGGDGSIGHRHSEETKRKRSVALKLAWAEGRKRSSGGWKRSHSKETRAKISIGLRSRPKLPKRICSVGGCLRYTHSQGFCSIHSHRFRRYGNPTAGNPIGKRGPAKGTKYQRELPTKT